jgi:hypothetical protein
LLVSGKDVFWCKFWQLRVISLCSRFRTLSLRMWRKLGRICLTRSSTLWSKLTQQLPYLKKTSNTRLLSESVSTRLKLGRPLLTKAGTIGTITGRLRQARRKVNLKQTSWLSSTLLTSISVTWVLYLSTWEAKQA